MKTNYLFLSLTIGALLLGSCEADDTADIVINNTDNSVTNNNGSTSNPDPEDPTGENVNLEGSYDENKSKPSWPRVCTFQILLGCS